MSFKSREAENEYMRRYMAERYERRRSAVVQLGGACVRCGATEDLDFDHIDRSTKSFTIGSRLAGVSEARLQAELAKCQLLCRPCHIAKSRAGGEFGGGHNRTVNPEHGTQVMYGREKCRCDTCRLWARHYRLKLVDARGVWRG